MTADALIQMVLHGDFKNIADITKLLKITSHLPNLIHELQSSLPAVTTFITDFGKKSQQIRGNLNDVWSQETPGLEISTIQALAKGQVVSVVDSINAAFSTAKQLLTNLPVGGKSVTVEIKVASYQRWPFISMDMLYLRTGNQKSGGLYNIGPIAPVLSVPIQ